MSRPKVEVLRTIRPLSHTPLKFAVGSAELEPATPGLEIIDNYKARTTPVERESNSQRRCSRSSFPGDSRAF